MKIIKDCINLLKNNENNINSANLIVPTLIPQIEGIQMEFMKLNGLYIDYGIVYKSDGELLKDESGNKIDKKSYFRQLTLNNEYYDIMNDVFLDVLFKKTKPREDCTSINFSRNKILHGESTSYGRRKNMIRCFMILDFLSELIFIEDDNWLLIKINFLIFFKFKVFLSFKLSFFNLKLYNTLYINFIIFFLLNIWKIVVNRNSNLLEK